MNLCYLDVRRLSFLYSTIFLIVDTIVTNTIQNCGYFQLVTTIRMYWYMAYLILLYYTNNRITLYGVWLMDVLRIGLWIYTIVLYINYEGSCAMKTYNLVMIIISGVINGTYIDTRKIDISEVSETYVIDIDRNHTITLCEVYGLYWQGEERPSIINLVAYRGEQVTCTICLEDIQQGNPIADLRCVHKFHINCFMSWLNYNESCPLCRLIV